MQHAPISRTRYMQENRKMRFQEAYEGWNDGRLNRANPLAALLLSCRHQPAASSRLAIGIARRPLERVQLPFLG